MTVSTDTDVSTYVGNGVTTNFPFTFKIFKKEHLLVQVKDHDGVMHKILNYSVNINSNDGSITLPSPLTVDHTIYISRDLPIVQETSFRNQGGFFPKVHEDAFDYLTMLIQKCYSILSRCLKYPLGGVNYEAENRKIVDLADPENEQDAVNKRHLEQVIKDVQAGVGIISLGNGLVKLYIDIYGYLILVHNDEDSPPPVHIDSDGNLIYTFN